MAVLVVLGKAEAVETATAMVWTAGSPPVALLLDGVVHLGQAVQDAVKWPLTVSGSRRRASAIGSPAAGLPTPRRSSRDLFASEHGFGRRVGDQDRDRDLGVIG
jgi:hypothetical protein